MFLTEKKKDILTGKGQQFERIRRITGYLVGPWTAGTMPNAPRNMTV